MMKTLVLVLVLMLAVGGACLAATGTIDLYAGYNLISIPNVPIDPIPANLFSAFSLDGIFSKFDATTGSDVGYSMWDPDSFGDVLLGEGYWLTSDSVTNVTFSGLDDGVPSGGVKTDMWISLPGNQYDGLDAGGICVVGNPYASSVNKGNFYFTEGTTLKSWQEAFDAGWVADAFNGYEGATGSSVLLSLSWGDTDDFAPARAYYFQTFKDNLAMIIVAP